MAIADWPESERPRERLLAQGAGSLSDAELVAVLLRTGVLEEECRDIVQRFFRSRRGGPPGAAIDPTE